MATDPGQGLPALARELRRRADALLERYAPAAQVRSDRLVMLGDAGVMEYAAGVIEKTSDRGLPPALAAARGLRGEPRFHPFDEHPATARLRDQRRQLRLLRAQIESRRYEPELIGSREIKEAILQNEVALRYINEEIAMFEETELRAQADYLRTVRRG